MRKTTLLDIAVKAGVSKATVSMVLNKKDGSISATI
jgi:LacI family transcriptional regulator